MTVSVVKLRQWTGLEARKTYPVAAAMHAQVGCGCDGSAEPKDDVEGIQGNVGNGHAVAIQEGCGQEVQQRQQAEDSDKHVVVHH